MSNDIDDDELIEVTVEQKDIDVLTELYDRDGKLTREQVLDDPRMHDRFEWDDTIAGHNYRLLQAGAIIRKAKVIIEETKVRAFVHIPSAGSYAPIREAMTNVDYRAEVLSDFEKDAARFEQRWADVKVVAAAYQAWAAAQAKPKRKRKPKS